MMNGKINIALIYGSTREGRFCDKCRAVGRRADRQPQ